MHNVLSTYYVPGPVLSTGERTGNETDKNPALTGAHTLMAASVGEWTDGWMDWMDGSVDGG